MNKYNLSLAIVLAMASVSLMPQARVINPSLEIWGMTQNITGTVQGQMLDTFSNHINITTSAPVNLKVMTMQAAEQYTINKFWYWLLTDKNIMYMPKLSEPQPIIVEQFNGTHFDFYFNLSEGCAAYIYLITPINSPSVIIHPNVWATYDPAPNLTGACNT